MEKPTLPKGTRDFGPAQMAKRQFIFDNIKKVFQKYGFQPLETPAMENLTTLTGKYGEEGDSLLFRISDSGNITENLGKSDFIHSYYKDEGLSTSKELLTIYSGLQEGLLNMCRYIFDNLSDEELRDSKEIQKIITNQFDYCFIGTIDQPLKSTLKSFVFNETATLANSLVFFFERSELYKSNYIEKLDFCFQKHFIGNILIPNFSNVLGEFLTNKNVGSIINLPSKKVLKEITEKGLRYDLTVPFARYVVMNRGEMTFPFKRYQIQPVWRADRPQKGRYREFYQCDADVVGTDSLICEAEIMLMIREVFKALGIADYTIKINHRGVLAGLAELAGAKENQMALFVAIDKLDKIGEAKVKEELIGKGFSESSLNTVFEILNFKGTTTEKVALLQSKFAASESGVKGIKDLTEAFGLLADYGTDQEHVEFDIALARGLSYYTGCIFEVKINNVAIGSVSGGGRYDNLTGGFGLPNVSGVGISFGVDRLYDAMEELKAFPESTQASSKVLICHFDEESKRYGLKVVNALRHSGIASEIYPDSVKINKQLDYANKKSIPFTIVIGSDEVKSGVLSFKDMRVGEQSKLSIDEILKKLAVGTGQ